MILEEAAQLLQLMRGTWPRLAPDEVADRLWLEDLAALDAKPAMEAFRSLRESEPRTPSWALFVEAYRAQARRFEPRAIAAPADEWEPPSEESKRRVHEMMNDLSAMLTGRKPRPYSGDAA